jgi:hypothetical protein
MQAYRVYFLGPAGHIVGATDIAATTGDADAVAKAKQLRDGKDLEVWQAARFVSRLEHDQEANHRRR